MATANLIQVGTPGPVLATDSGGAGSVITTGYIAVPSIASGAWVNVDSVTLTAGKWLVFGILFPVSSGRTFTGGSLSTVSAASTSSWPVVSAGWASSTTPPFHIAAVISVTSSLTVYLNGNSVSTLAGFIRAIQIG